MATLTPTLTLTSTNASTDNLSLSVTDSLTVGNPAVNVARQEVATTGQFNVLTAADNTSITYVYLKNIDNTNVIIVKDDAGNAIIDLSPGEFAFFPVKGGTGLEATADTAACVLEYGYWTKA
tara:strand:- start:425 stop:790 length:366 start_codon:yes stop_codon:yes gene_type:complete